jgi:hypothetical protein
MAGWLASVFGVVIIGVIIELVSKNTPTGRFVRSVYSFVILFVIIEPIPGMLSGGGFKWEGIAVNADLLQDITGGTTSKQAQVQSILKDLGYKDAIVTISGSAIYVNTGRNLSASDIIEIKQAIGEDNLYIV